MNYQTSLKFIQADNVIGNFDLSVKAMFLFL